MSLRLLAAAWLLCGAASSVSAGDEPAAPAGDFRVVGYLPDYRAGGFDPASARGLTDLILFSAEPAGDGGLNLDRLKAVPWAKLREFKTQQRVRLILCVGGWGRSRHFAAVAGSEELRGHFVKEAVRACLNNRLDGLDLDWEHPKDEKEQDGYGSLLKDLRDGFRPHGLALTVTVAGWQRLPREAFAAADAVQVMAYDHKGQHSTFEAAKADVKAVTDQGVPGEKVVLGLPFYGRHVTRGGVTLTYRQIVARYQPAPEIDEVESVCFNGPQTIRRKTEFALESRLGGVMVWELGQDAEGRESLLRVIGETVRANRK